MMKRIVLTFLTASFIFALQLSAQAEVDARSVLNEFHGQNEKTVLLDVPAVAERGYRRARESRRLPRGGGLA